MSDFVQPKLWASDQLDLDIEAAIDAFRSERFEESAELYPENFDSARDSIETLLEQTVDLSMIAETARDVLSDVALVDALRYLAGPPISKDDLLVLVKAKSTLQFHDPEVAARIIETIRATLDQRRFPWVVEERPPTEEERHAAIIASAALMASQRTATWRRNQAKANQEAAVKQALLDHGFEEVAIPRKKIRTPLEAPKAGQFCGEVMLGSRKADIVAGLWDARLMPIECKVSNSFLNSVKRLNNDAAVKATVWKKEFGDFIVPVAVISGVFKRINIEDAQKKGLMIVWGHRLKDLTDFIDQTRNAG